MRKTVSARMLVLGSMMAIPALLAGCQQPEAPPPPAAAPAAMTPPPPPPPAMSAMDQARADYRAAREAIAAGNKEEAMAALSRLRAELPQINNMQPRQVGSMTGGIDSAMRMIQRNNMRGAERALDQALMRTLGGPGGGMS